MGVSMISDYIQIKIKMTNPSQEPPVSSKAQNEDLKDMDAFCTFKIKIETKWNGCSLHLENQDRQNLNMGV